MMPDDETGHAQKFSQLMEIKERIDEDPSVENYIALRRIAPGFDTEIHRFAGVDPLQALGQELEQARLDRALIRSALGGNDHDIDELCLQLMERLIERKRLETRGETHLQGRGNGISDALVSHLIVAMMEVLQQDRLGRVDGYRKYRSRDSRITFSVIHGREPLVSRWRLSRTGRAL